MRVKSTIIRRVSVAALIAGTVTADTLTAAAEDLFRGTVIVGDGR